MVIFCSDGGGSVNANIMREKCSQRSQRRR